MHHSKAKLKEEEKSWIKLDNNSIDSFAKFQEDFSESGMRNIFVCDAEPIQQLFVRLEDHGLHLLHRVDLFDLVVDEISEGVEEVFVLGSFGFKHVLLNQVAKRIPG